MLAALLAPLLALAPSQAADLHVPSDLPAGTPPAHTFEVTRVVDGDTIWIERGGEREKLRLLNVDTEEKISSWHPDSTSKPQTVFGEETKIWAKELFESIAEPGERPRVGLLFPGGREVRGRYGRLLAEVI
ncbi:MAG TPA: hypothetical protein ENJ09_08305, partial [Planctomycetes bacterium]|nr:hypothetical protein [Planctomycetota bacterium]